MHFSSTALFRRLIALLFLFLAYECFKTCNYIVDGNTHVYLCIQEIFRFHFNWQRCAKSWLALVRCRTWNEHGWCSWTMSWKHNHSRATILFQSFTIKLHFKSTIWTQFYKIFFQLSIIWHFIQTEEVWIHKPLFRCSIFPTSNYLSNDIGNNSKWATIYSQILGIKLEDSLSSTIPSSGRKFG